MVNYIKGSVQKKNTESIKGKNNKEKGQQIIQVPVNPRSSVIILKVSDLSAPMKRLSGYMEHQDLLISYLQEAQFKYRSPLAD